MSGRSPLVVVTEKQFEILKEFAAARTIAVDLSQRSKVILLAFEKKLNEEISQIVGLHRNHIGTWRSRWKEAFYDLVAVECREGIAALRKAIIEVLSDRPRSGRPPTITSEQRSQLVSLACEPPKESGLPISRWTSEELSRELIRRDIFESVSSSSVRRWLDELDLKPHRHKYWLFSSERGTPEFDAKVRLICDVYAEAIEAYESYGIHTICMDEQSGIQATERIASDYRSISGQCAKFEYEYQRHGTTCLFGNFHVATGRMISPLLRSTRTEVDFVDNLRNVIGSNPTARFRIIADNLNTHYSESCVRYIAEQCGIDQSELGQKGRYGILKDKASRQAFLSNPLHRIHFYFLPKHSSWLNQVEIWFGVLRSKVTRFGSFCSVNNLNDKITQFIDYYNDILAHPYQWTYRGKTLCV
ncbi:MAG: IS630 family transposase [Pirellula sp.]